MQKLKKILRPLFFTLLGLFSVICVMLVFATVKYNSIVSSVPKNSSALAQPGKLGKYVNTFIGTGGFPYWVCGFNFPGATVPFGMVRLSPETMSVYKDTKALNTSGYYYADTKLLGFSHTRLAGTGATDGGHFLFTPTIRPINKIDFTKDCPHRFSHEDETSFPGYYGIHLKDENILCEFTATQRCGLHRYTFSKRSNKNIILNITNTLGDYEAKDGTVKILSKNKEIEGSVLTYGTFARRNNGIQVYFVARFDQPFSYGIWDGQVYRENLDQAKSDSLKLNLNFKKETVNVKLGISYVSIENARLNLDSETDHFSFEEILSKAKSKWESKLALIEIEGGTNDEKTVFYSALYRSFQMPTTFNDVNGQYIGFDNKVHQTTNYTYYTDLSLWDTFRTIHPLYNLIAQKEQRDMLVSLVNMAEQGGSLPRWPMGHGYSNSMLGSPADMVIAESYLKGIRDFDFELAYKYMKKTALNPLPKNTRASGRRGIAGYLEYGYCPTELGDRAVSQTLEYAWADHSISLMAKKLGYDEDFQLFDEHSKYYKNVWNNDTQYFQSRKKDGSFVTAFKPLKLSYFDSNGKYTKDYVEGSALQWRWAVPFDPDGLLALFKSNDYFVNELNNFFLKSDPQMATWNPGSYYWHGNEPDIHAAYLFNEAGRPDLTQKWVRWILDNKYGNSYTGIDGNDDAGTLSAWYIFSSLGFYPIAGSDIYQLGAPLFRNARIKLEKHILNIETKNYAPSNLYVNKILLNGKALDRYWIRHSEIAEGGNLQFIMGKEPTVLNK